MWPLVALTCTLVGLVVAQRDVVPYTPISIPLAARGPYLGTWLIGPDEQLNLATTSPSFWTTLPIGWTGLVRVDGEVWKWMGNVTEWTPTIQVTAESTSFSTTFLMTNDPATVSLNATFVTPVTPRDLFRQSLPFSYLEIAVASLDGQEHDVQVYTDINGLWLANDEAEALEWETTEADTWTGMRVRLQNQRLFSEEELPGPFDKDRILHGDVWYAAKSGNDQVETAFAAGFDARASRQLFAQEGSLDNAINSTFRSTRRRDDDDQSRILDEPVWAFSHSFGTVSPATALTDASVVLAIGHVRDPIAQTKVADGSLKPIRPLWSSVFESVPTMLDFLVSDYENVRDISVAFNRQLFADARRVETDEYAYTVAISTRQVFSAMEGAWDESEHAENSTLVTYSPFNSSRAIPTLWLLKEVSSNGNCQTVDVIAPFLPFSLYTAPEMLPMLLEPHYRYAASGSWVPRSPPHDLGDHYPNFTMHDDYNSHGPLPIEEAGNMLGMAYAAIARSETGEETLSRAKDQAVQWYSLLKQWTDYLVEHALFPREQSSTDDFEGPTSNQTSLTVKGIMGIRAFSEIARNIGNDEDASAYLDEANKMTNRFLELAVSKDRTHLISHYGNDTSWHSQYNLYFDRLFNTSQFPQWLYEMQDRFYPTVAQPYGVPLDSANGRRAKTDWFAWLSATTLPSSSDLRTQWVDFVSKYFRKTHNLWFGDLIDVVDGGSVGFQLRPVVGGHFALLGVDLMDRVRNGTFPVKAANDDNDDDDDDDGTSQGWRDLYDQEGTLWDSWSGLRTAKEHWDRVHETVWSSFALWGFVVVMAIGGVWMFRLRKRRAADMDRFSGGRGGGSGSVGAGRGVRLRDDEDDEDEFYPSSEDSYGINFDSSSGQSSRTSSPVFSRKLDGSRNDGGFGRGRRRSADARGRDDVIVRLLDDDQDGLDLSDEKRGNGEKRGV